MFFNRVEAKMRARRTMRQGEPRVLLVSLIFVILTVGLTTILEQLFVTNTAFAWSDFPIYISMGYEPIEVLQYLSMNIFGVGVVSIVLQAIFSIYNTVMSVGWLSYCMRAARQDVAGYRNLFDGFVLIFRVIGILILQAIYVLLWSIVAFIPCFIFVMIGIFTQVTLFLVMAIVCYIGGIIFAVSISYRYRLALYFMIDNPDMGCNDTITASKEAMVGRKKSLFSLDLSFIGWAFLGMITFGVLYIWVSPYISITEANFYDMAVHGRYSAPEPIF